MEVTPVAIAVVEHEGRYLVGQRGPDRVLGGLWEFPGGKVEWGESPAGAAQRECWEETGIRVAISHCLAVQEHCYEHGQVQLHFFACRPVFEEAGDPRVVPAPPYQWVSRQQLAGLQFPAANRSVLAQLLQ